MALIRPQGILKWQPSDSADVASYRIYQNADDPPWNRPTTARLWMWAWCWKLSFPSRACRQSRGGWCLPWRLLTARGTCPT